MARGRDNNDPNDNAVRNKIYTFPASGAVPTEHTIFSRPPSDDGDDVPREVVDRFIVEKAPPNPLFIILFGVLVCLAEVPPLLPGDLWNSYLPFVMVLVEYIQLSSLNQYVVPAFNNAGTLLEGYLEISIDWSLRSTSPALLLRAVAGIGITILGIGFLGVYALAFILEAHSSCLFRPLATWAYLTTQPLYMPVLQNLMVLAMEGGHHPLLSGLASVMAAWHLTWALVLSQNSHGLRDKMRMPSGNLHGTKHERVSIVLLLVKTATIITHNISPIAGGITNLLSFALLFSVHFLTWPYHNHKMNRMYNVLYGVLLWGAACRVGGLALQRDTADRLYWGSVLFIAVIAWYLEGNRYYDCRLKANRWLEDKLSFMDWVDSPSLLYRCDMGEVVRDCGRLGKLGLHLSRMGRVQEAEYIFDKAQQINKDHPEMLALNAVYLATHGKKKESKHFFERALRGGYTSREALETYAFVLNEEGGEQSTAKALFLYQASIKQDPSHYIYRGCYENSSDATCIIDPTEGTIMDVNGAALRLFRARGQDELVGKTLSTLLVDETALRNHMTMATAQRGWAETSHNGARFKGIVRTLAGNTLSADIVMSKTLVGHQPVFVLSFVHIPRLKALLRKNQLMFERSSLPSILINEEGKILEWNGAAQKSFGYSKQQAVGQNITFLMPEPYKSEHAGYLQRYLETGFRKVIGKERDVPVVNKAGVTRICTLKVNEIVLDEGGPRYFIGLLHDVTDLKMALDLSEGVFTEAATPMVMIDHTGVIQKWNRDAENVFEYPAAEAIGQNITILMPEKYASRHAGYLEKYLQTGEKHIIGSNRDIPTISKTGKRRTCTLKVNEMRLGSTVFFIGLFVDVTDYRMALAKATAVFERGLSPMVVINTHGTILQYNEASHDFFGYTADEMIGQNVKVLMPPEVAVHHDYYLDKYRETGVKTVVGNPRQVLALTKAGKRRACMIRVNELTSDSFLGIFVDMQDAAEADALCKAVFDRGEAPMVILKNNGTITQYNNGSEKLFGYAAAEVLGHSIGMLLEACSGQDQDLGWVTCGPPGMSRRVMALTKAGSKLPCMIRMDGLTHNRQLATFEPMSDDVGAERDNTAAAHPAEEG